MADDITLPGTAAVVATDEVSSRHFQVVKQAWGPDGTATQVAIDAALPTGVGSVMLSGSTTAFDTDAIASTDASGYQMITIALSGTYSAAVQLQGSNDNTNWMALPTNAVGSTIAVASTGGLSTNATSLIYVATIPTRYIRVRCSFYSSGTLTATARLYNGAHTGLLPATLAVTTSGSQSASDADSNTPWTSIKAFQIGFNGATWDRGRFPKIFKSASATSSGDTAVWTPTSGKRFQLLRFALFLTEHATQSSAGTITVTLRDNTTSTGIAIPVHVPGTGGTLVGSWASGWIDLGPFGFRSAAINQVLNVNLSAALTAGALGVVAVGTEE